MRVIEKRKYIFYGSKKDLDTLEKFLRHMEYLGNVGASRNLLLRVDGDGFGQIKVRDEKDHPLDNEHYNLEQNLEQGSLVGIYDIG